MPVQLCSVRGCLNEGRYCRLHQVETFKPAKKISKEADSRKELNNQYRKIAKKFIALNPKCQVKGCNSVSECVHHMRGRIGDLLTDTRHFLAVCMDHHRQIESNPEWARKEGYSKSRLKATV